MKVLKIYKFIFNLSHGGKRHMIVRATDCFQALLYAIDYSKGIRRDVNDFDVKQIKGIITLSRVEVRFLETRLKELKNIRGSTMPAVNHPAWLIKDGIVRGGYHAHKHWRVWIKETGDWLSFNMDTGELIVKHDNSRLIAYFDEWGCYENKL